MGIIKMSVVLMDMCTNAMKQKQISTWKNVNRSLQTPQISIYETQATYLSKSLFEGFNHSIFPSSRLDRLDIINSYTNSTSILSFDNSYVNQSLQSINLMGTERVQSVFPNERLSLASSISWLQQNSSMLSSAAAYVLSDYNLSTYGTCASDLSDYNPILYEILPESSLTTLLASMETLPVTSNSTIPFPYATCCTNLKSDLHTT